MGKLNDLCAESYKIAKEHGWHDEERSISAITLLMQSEVAEIVEEYRKHKGLGEIWYEVHHETDGCHYTTIGKPGDKPCGIPVEIADLVIRIADYCGKCGINLELSCHGSPEPEHTADFEEWLARINYALSQAWARSIPGTEFWLGVATKLAFRTAKYCNIDLWVVIDEKTAFNRTRPYRHGGKKI
jgi:NTP pyrophosphatase (non-canonical NTP hydrolase)